MVLSKNIVLLMAQRGVNVRQTPDRKGHIAFRKCACCEKETPATELEVGRGMCPDCYVRKAVANIR
jgi:hypothetical protein